MQKVHAEIAHEIVTSLPAIRQGKMVSGPTMENNQTVQIKPALYVETTVISHLAARPSRQPIIHANQLLTRQWWDTRSDAYTLVASETVFEECSKGDRDAVSRRRAVLARVSKFAVSDRIIEVATALLGPAAIPPSVYPDALHIAAAAVYGCDYLLTWNFRHIANPVLRRNVERILADNGYSKTIICTPQEALAFPS